MTNLLKLSVKQKDKESADHIANILHFRHSRYINSQIKVFNAFELLGIFLMLSPPDQYPHTQ